MDPELYTDKLSMKSLTSNDYGFIQDLLNTDGWLTFIGNRNINTKDDAIRYIEKINSTNNLTYWAVRITATDTPIGIISFLKREYLPHFDIGFAFLPGFQGNGYACEASDRVLKMLSKKQEHPVILASTIPGNISSIKLLKKLGFNFEKEIFNEGETLHIYATIPT